MSGLIGNSEDMFCRDAAQMGFMVNTCFFLKGLTQDSLCKHNPDVISLAKHLESFYMNLGDEQ